jgi:hypothetical protein
MALTIEISFVANTAGNHDVCYREVGTSTFTCVTVNAALGANTIVINPPTNYCGDVTFEGYVIAECSNPADNNLNDFPDVVEGISQFTILVTAQPADCDPYRVTCDATKIGGILVTVGGMDYVDGEVVVANGVDNVGTVNVVPASNGVVGSITLTGTNTYPSPPTLTITTAGGSLAELQALMDDCVVFLAGCDGQVEDDVDSPIALRTELPLSSNITICSNGVPDVEPATGDYTVIPDPIVPENCRCTDCVQMTVTNVNVDTAFTLSYTSCNNPAGEGGETATVFYQHNFPVGAFGPLVLPICAIQESISWEPVIEGFSVGVTPCP